MEYKNQLVRIYSEINQDISLSLAKPFLLAKLDLIEKKRSIKIPLRFHLKDPSGLNKTSLEGLLATCGIKNPFKSSLTKKEKSFMEHFAKENTNEFLNYAISDVLSLSMVPQALTNNINSLLIECYGFQKLQLFSPNTLPMTIGSIVAAIFETYIQKQFQEIPEIDPDLFSDLLNQTAIPISFLKSQKKKKNKNGNGKVGKLNKKYYSSFIDAGGCRSLALGYAKNTGVLNTLVTGGRCNNEQAFHYQKKLIFDFDLLSCYGSALTKFLFPVGLPMIYAKTHQDPTLTLKEFLEKYEKDLVENLYTITVSGSLSFHQNLIYSKIVDEKKLSEKILTIISENTEDEIDVIEDGVCQVLLLEKEIRHGIITSDILQALRKICSNLEWSEIANLEVDTAIYYSKKYYVKEKSEFLQKVMEKPGSYTYSVEKQTVFDDRSRFWTTIELKDFIGPLLTKRKKVKKQMNDSSLTPEEKFQLNGQQQTLKLLVNTLYGVFCSPYFSVSNTILANNITARARLGVWQSSRVLNGIQCITDGFAYSPTQVFQLKENQTMKKPGLNVLSDLDLLQNHRFIETIDLGNMDWKTIFETNSFDEIPYYQNLDENVEEHLARFWSSYDLTIPYQVEHKKENTGMKMVYFKRAHYAILKRNQEILYKFRGLHLNSVEDENPTFFKLAKALLVDDSEFRLDEKNTVYNTTELNTINDYFQSLKKRDREKKERLKKESEENQKEVIIPIIESKIEREILIPGFPRIDQKIFHFNLSDLPSLNFKMYKMLENTILDKEILEVPFEDFHRIKLEMYNRIKQKFQKYDPKI